VFLIIVLIAAIPATYYALIAFLALGVEILNFLSDFWLRLNE
jgi:hypothetical protein